MKSNWFPLPGFSPDCWSWTSGEMSSLLLFAQTQVHICSPAMERRSSFGKPQSHIQVLCAEHEQMRTLPDTHYNWRWCHTFPRESPSWLNCTDLCHADKHYQHWWQHQNHCCGRCIAMTPQTLFSRTPWNQVWWHTWQTPRSQCRWCRSQVSPKCGKRSTSPPSQSKPFPSTSAQWQTAWIWKAWTCWRRPQWCWPGPSAGCPQCPSWSGWCPLGRTGWPLGRRCRCRGLAPPAARPASLPGRRRCHCPAEPPRSSWSEPVCGSWPQPGSCRWELCGERTDRGTCCSASHWMLHKRSRSQGNFCCNCISIRCDFSSNSTIYYTHYILHITLKYLFFISDFSWTAF